MTKVLETRMSGVTKAALHERLKSVEKKLELELSSADLMDELLKDWAANMRDMSRHNIQLSDLLTQVMIYCDLSGIMLPMRDRMVDVLFLDEKD